MLLATAVASLPLRAADDVRPTGQQVIEKVRIDQHLDAQIPMDLAFRDEAGKRVRLNDYFDGPPAILVLAYYRCPMLCTEVLNSLSETIRRLPLGIGKNYRVITVSIDPRETPQLAAAKQSAYTSDFHDVAAAKQGWRFLTGEEESIHALAASIGYHYIYDAELNQYAHPSGIVVLTPQGKIARYFFGIDYPPGDVRLALTEASAGKIGTLADQFILLCYHFDESTGRYTLAVMRFVRLGGVLTIIAVATLLIRGWRRDKRNAQSSTTT